MDEVLSMTLAEPRLQVAGLSVFGAVALVLGTVGIYSVVSYLTSRRTYDIGVLLALGAGPRRVLRDVLYRGMKPVLLGVSGGLVSALLLSRWLASLLHGVSPSDPATAAFVAALLAACALVACYLPARRASRIDPATSLRVE